MAKKSKYKIGIGLWKSLKNVAIIAGIPAVIFLIDNWTQWLPDEYNAIAAPIFGFVAYFIKNKLEN